jgi:hypothetical protein
MPEQSLLGRSPAELTTIFYSHLRLPQPGGSGSRIYIPPEQGDPVIPPGTGLRRICVPNTVSPQNEHISLEIVTGNYQKRILSEVRNLSNFQCSVTRTASTLRH